MWILLAGVVAALCSLHREMLRLVLHAYRRPEAVLGADIPYVILLISGAALATITPMPAAATVHANSSRRPLIPSRDYSARAESRSVKSAGRGAVTANGSFVTGWATSMRDACR